MRRLLLQLPQDAGRSGGQRCEAAHHPRTRSRRLGSPTLVRGTRSRRRHGAQHAIQMLIPRLHEVRLLMCDADLCLDCQQPSLYLQLPCKKRNTKC